MTPSLIPCFSTPSVQSTLLPAAQPQGSALQTIVEILKRPRVRTCGECQGKGLLSHHAVCPACNGFGKTP